MSVTPAFGRPVPPDDESASADPVGAVAGGDERQLATLLDALWVPLLRYARRFVDGMDAAQDVVQEAFIRFWENRERWQAGGSARQILYVLTRNAALNARSSEAARARRGRLAGGATPSPDPLEALATTEVCRAVRCAVAALPERQREAIVLARFHGLSRREIAAVMGIAEQTVANHLAAGLSRLADLLQPLADPDPRTRRPSESPVVTERPAGAR